MSLESNFTLEDYVRILNQYQELKQENQQLKEDNKTLRENYENGIKLLKQNKQLKFVLDEIREYVNKNSIYFATKEKVGNYFANCSCDELLQILDKAENL